MFVLILYRHAQDLVDGRASTPEDRVIIKEHHFFMSSDDTDNWMLSGLGMPFLYLLVTYGRGASLSTGKSYIYMD